MNIKHLQLNTSELAHPEKIAKYIVKNSFDTICLQEVRYPFEEKNPLVELLEQAGYHYREGINLKYMPTRRKYAVGIASKFPILDTVRVFWNGNNHEPKEINEGDFLGERIFEDHGAVHNYPGSRGIKHATKSSCNLMCLVKTPKGVLRLVTTHFIVSDLCTETQQMYDHATLLASMIKHSQDVPTILSADLNIRAESYSVLKLREVIDCHSLGLTDTLSKDHVAKAIDFPEGLAIDHVFSKGVTFKSITAVEIKFSDHKAIISEFSI